MEGAARDHRAYAGPCYTAGASMENDLLFTLVWLSLLGDRLGLRWNAPSARTLLRLLFWREVFH